MQKAQWTKSKARLSRMSQETDSDLNWIFVPGGPGLGSEIFKQLTNQIELPGVVWHFDFPNDGSNRLKNFQFSEKIWKQSLLESVDLFNHPVLVAHSFGGMVALSIPELEKKLGGLILMNSSPNQEWMKLFSGYTKVHPNPALEQAKLEYSKMPSDQTFKEFTLLAAPYFFTELSMKEGLALLSKLPYSHKSYDWAQTYFHPNYEANLILNDFPVLVLGGELDFLTPLILFSKNPCFSKDNIEILELKGVGHFPWVGNCKLVQEILNVFIKKLKAEKGTEIS